MFTRTQFNQFNLDAPDVVSTPSAPTNVYEAMAQFGRHSDQGQTAETPSFNTEPTADAPAEAAPVIDAPSATPAPEAQATPAVPAATEEPTVAVPAPIDAPAPEVPSWQEVLRNQQPHDVLKELGYDDRQIGWMNKAKDLPPQVEALVETYLSGGDINAYLQELSTDYSKMPAEDVMRHQLQREYPDADAETIQYLFEDEVIRKYNLDSDDEEEVRRGQKLLEAKSGKYRNELIAKQQEKLLPKPPQKEEPSVDPALKAAEETFGAYKQKVDASPAAKTLLQNGKIELGDYGFHYTLQNAEGIVKNLTDVLQTYISVGKMTPENIGQFSEDFIQDQLLIGAFSQNPRGFLKEFSQHLKSLGEKEVINTIDNAKLPDNSTPAPSEPQPKTAAEAMARFGRSN